MHSALSQKAGDVYHYYIAILYMFQIEDWSKCTIEESGDIAFYNIEEKQIYNIEVKHHIEPKELKIYEEEFLKTLYNWFNIRKQFNEHTQLILFTTSNISEHNILKYWNSFDNNKRYKELQANSKKRDGSYYANITKYLLPISRNVNILKELLNKIVINESSPNILNIKNRIFKNSYFNSFSKDEHKNEVINSLYGLIGEGLKGNKKWKITKKEFNQKLKELTVLAQEKILRTDDDIKIKKQSVKDYKEKLFIKKLENIEFKEDVMELAVNDYAKTVIEASKRMELTNSVEYKARLNGYEESLIKQVNEVQIKYKYRSGDNIRKSQESYFEIMESSKVPFMPQEFDDRTTFFQKGYFHILADDDTTSKKICWSLKPEDLS